MDRQDHKAQQAIAEVKARLATLEMPGIRVRLGIPERKGKLERPVTLARRAIREVRGQAVAR